MVVAVTATVPSVPLEILSPFPKVISLPVTVRSPLTDVVVAVMATVPSVLFVMVSSFCKIIPVEPVTSRLVLAVTVLNVPAPLNPVAVITPVEGLYVAVPSDSKPILPPSTSPPDVNTKALLSSVLSLSVIVTDVAPTADQLSVPLPSVTIT